jgi:hypothetical protein
LCSWFDHRLNKHKHKYGFSRVHNSSSGCNNSNGNFNGNNSSSSNSSSNGHPECGGDLNSGVELRANSKTAVYSVAAAIGCYD